MTGAEGKDPQFLEKKIKDYNKTGKFNVAVDDRLSSSVAVNNKLRGSLRESKLNRANYFLDPRSMMSNIH